MLASVLNAVLLHCYANSWRSLKISCWWNFWWIMKNHLLMILHMNLMSLHPSMLVEFHEVLCHQLIHWYVTLLNLGFDFAFVCFCCLTTAILFALGLFYVLVCILSWLFWVWLSAHKSVVS